MRNIYLATTAYTGNVRVETMQAILHDSQLIARKGWNVNVRVSAGDSILSHARNHFIADFLASPAYTDLVFIDHDVAWEPGALARICGYELDVVAGVYPKRTMPLQWPVRVKDGTSLVDPETGLMEAEGVPAGFLRLSRRCLQSMTEHYWHLRYAYGAAPGGFCTSLFDFKIIDGAYWGEDFVFCRRWRDMGGRIWVDPNIQFAHCGTWQFQGHLGNALREAGGQLETGAKDFQPEGAGGAENEQRINVEALEAGRERVRVKARSEVA
jgi:hypothetical protein